MSVKRRQHSAEYRLKVALGAAKGDQTLSQLAEQHELHPGQISEWKRQVLDEGAGVSQNCRAQKERAQAAQEAELYEQIGRLKMEMAWPRKKSAPLDRR